MISSNPDKAKVQNDLSKRREEIDLERKKDSRNSYFQKFRASIVLSSQSINSEFHLNYITISQRDFSSEELDKLLIYIKSNDPNYLLEGLVGLRKLLSFEDCSLIQKAMDSGIFKKIMKFMQNKENIYIRIESTWIIANLACGIGGMKFIEMGFVQILFEMIEEKNEMLLEQILWALGNISADSFVCRDHILGYNKLEILIKYILNSSDLRIWKIGSWLVSNLCKGRPLVKFEMIKPAVYFFSEILKRINKETETFVEILYAFSFLADGENERVETIIESGIITQFFDFFESCPKDEVSILLPLIRIIGSLLTGKEKDVEYIVKLNVIHLLFSLINFPKKFIKKEACLSLSMITNKREDFLQLYFHSPTYMRNLFGIIRIEPGVRLTALFLLENLIKSKFASIIEKLVEAGCIDLYLDLLDDKNESVVLISLKSLEKILKFGNSLHEINSYALELQNKNGFNKLEALLLHPLEKIYLKTIQIIETYFEIDS